MKRKKSLIDWCETALIFNDGLKYIIGEISDNNYCDFEVKDEVKEDHYDDVFNKIDNFIPKKYNKFVCDNQFTSMGEEDILVRAWNNNNARLQLLTILDKEKSDNEMELYVPVEGCDSGYAIIYGDESTFLIVGNYFAHPFVYHPSFAFSNSDGSTFEDCRYDLLNFKQIKNILKRRALEYIFEQVH